MKKKYDCPECLVTPGGVCEECEQTRVNIERAHRLLHVLKDAYTNNLIEIPGYECHYMFVGLTQKTIILKKYWGNNLVSEVSKGYNTDEKFFRALLNEDFKLVSFFSLKRKEQPYVRGTN